MNRSEAAWLGNEQPVGEYPSLPMVARAYKSVDQLADELRSLKAANTELMQELVAVREQRSDARFEVDQLTDLLKKSGRHVSELSDAVASYAAERDEWRDRAEESEERVPELEIRLCELVTEIDELKAARDVARA